MPAPRPASGALRVALPVRQSGVERSATPAREETMPFLTIREILVKVERFHGEFGDRLREAEKQDEDHLVTKDQMPPRKSPQ